MRARGNLLMGSDRAAVVSPLVDLLFNMMITMFLFLMVYMAVVIPQEELRPIEFVDAQLPPAGLHADYHANFAVKYGSGNTRFVLAFPGQTHALELGPPWTAPPAANRLDQPGIATLEIDPLDGWLRATRIYPDGAPESQAVPTFVVPVVAIDQGRPTSIRADWIEHWGNVPLFFHQEQDESPALGDGEAQLAYYAIRKTFSVRVLRNPVPYDVSDQPLTATLPQQTTAIAGQPIEIIVPIVGGIEPYEVVITGTGAPWLQLVQPERSAAIARGDLANRNRAFGALRGTPPTAGQFSVMVEVKDAQTPVGDWGAARSQQSNRGCPHARIEFEIQVAQPLRAAVLVLPGYGRVGSRVQGFVVKEGGIGPFEFTATALPPDLTLSATGELSGTPTGVWRGPVEVTVIDKHPSAAGPVTARVADWRVIPPLPAPTLDGSTGR